MTESRIMPPKRYRCSDKPSTDAEHLCFMMTGIPLTAFEKATGLRAERDERPYDFLQMEIAARKWLAAS